MSWDSYAKIQAMLRDNHAEYDRNKTRGIPRDGEALLHGIVYCGECGHKMVVQYKNCTRYICNSLRQQHGTPVCQYIPAKPIDDRVVRAFFEALAPAELDMLVHASAKRRQADAATERAQAQQVERLRYRVSLAERQFEKVDPENRLVAAELEHRWEEALRDLRQAEAALAKKQEHPVAESPDIPEDLRAAFLDLGPRMPELWSSGTLTASRKKALLRSLVDKVVIHRSVRDNVRTRIVWRGGDVTELDIPITVGSLAELSCAEEMEKRIVELARAGRSDKKIADELTASGFRSPLSARVLRSTVQRVRLDHGIMQLARQSHPRRISGYLTVSQLASTLGVTKYWIYDRIHNGTISIAPDKRTKLWLFPDKPATHQVMRKLAAGKIANVTFK
jgi:hypothetical protein